MLPLLSYRIGVALFGHNGVLKHLFCLAEEHAVIVHPCRVMTDDKLLYMSLLGNGCSFFSRRVHRSFAAIGILLDVRRFVEKSLHAFDERNNRFRIFGIRAVGVTFNRLLVAMMLGEQESASRHLVFQGDSGYGECSVLEYHLALARIDGVKDHLVRHSLAVIIQPRLQQALQISRRINMQGLRSAHHAKGGDETYQSEAMIAMKMGDEDVVQSGCFQCHPAEPYLTPFAAIDHERLVTQLEHLTSRRVLECGQGAAAA